MVERSSKKVWLGNMIYSLILVAFGLAIFGLNYICMDFTKQKWPTHLAFLEFSETVIQGFSLLIVAVGVIALSIRKYLTFAWDNYLSKPLDSFVEITDKNLSQISEKVFEISKNIDAYIKQRGGPLTIHECKTRDDYSAYINHACSNVYGIHSANSNSLYSQVKTRLLDTFCCEPHQSNVKKRIKITNLANNPDFINWHEETEYKIHHVVYGIHATTGVFDIVYSASSYAPGVALEGWREALTFNVRVDGKYTILEDEDIKFEENFKDDGFFIWKRESWIFFRYKRRLVLGKEYTEIYFEENSINSSQDRIYSMQCGMPFYGLELDFQLPKEFAFRKDRFVSSEIAFNGLPIETKSKLSASQVFEIKQKSDNHININIKEWVLPGIVFKVDWDAVLSAQQ